MGAAAASKRRQFLYVGLNFKYNYITGVYKYFIKYTKNVFFPLFLKADLRSPVTKHTHGRRGRLSTVLYAGTRHKVAAAGPAQRHRRRQTLAGNR